MRNEKAKNLAANDLRQMKSGSGWPVHHDRRDVRMRKKIKNRKRNADRRCSETSALARGTAPHLHPPPRGNPSRQRDGDPIAGENTGGGSSPVGVPPRL